MAASTVISLNADEMTLLPETSSVEELLAYDGSCRTQLVPEVTGLASAISEGAVGCVAGPWRPEWWDANPQVVMRSVNLFKIRNAHYFPDYGVLIDETGRAMRSSMAQATYVTPDLLKLPHVRRVEDSIVLAPPEKFDRLAHAAVTMPWDALRSYGHFLMDCLSS